MQINIKNYQTKIILGIYPEEKTKPQKILISLKINFDAKKAIATDDIEYTIDYDKIVLLLEKTCQEKSYNLIETLIAKIEKTLKKEFSFIEKLWIKIIKSEIIKQAEEVSVEI